MNNSVLLVTFQQHLVSKKGQFSTVSSVVMHKSNLSLKTMSASPTKPSWLKIDNNNKEMLDRMFNKTCPTVLWRKQKLVTYTVCKPEFLSTSE